MRVGDYVVGKRRECGLIANPPGQFNQRVHEPRAVVMGGEINQMGTTKEVGMHGIVVGARRLCERRLRGANEPPLTFGRLRIVEGHLIQLAWLWPPCAVSAGLAAARSQTPG